MRIELTTPDGRVFEIDPCKIDVLEQAQPHLYAAGVNSIVHIGGMTQGVKQTVAEIKAMEK